MKMKKVLLFGLLLVLLSATMVVSADDWVEFTAPVNPEKAACTIRALSTEDTVMKGLLSEVTDEDWIIGPDDAILTILSYSDFECPYCSQAGLFMLDFQAAHPDEVRYVYRHMPLPYHEKAPTAAYAAEAAGKQGLFFEAEHFFYENQNTWTYLATIDEFATWIKDNIATGIPSLDYEAWLVDFDDPEIHEKVDGAFDANSQVKKDGVSVIDQTPLFFLNYYRLNGSYSGGQLDQYIELFRGLSLLGDKNFTDCPDMLIDTNAEYRAELETSVGTIEIDLYPAEAPLSVNSFVFLAEKGWYDGMKFTSVQDGFIAQTGDPSGTGRGHPGYSLERETNTLTFGDAGLVAMAKYGNDNNGSQFFISYDLKQYFAGQYLNANVGKEISDEALLSRVQENIDAMDYTIFGKVTEDTLSVIDQITPDTEISSIKIYTK